MKKYNFLDLLFSKESSAEEYYRCIEADEEIKELKNDINEGGQKHLESIIEINKLKEQNKEMLEMLSECRELFTRNKRRYVNSHQWEKACKARGWERILKRLIEKIKGKV